MRVPQFGKGVYFADMSSKSANYCFATSSQNTAVMLLCDVALGEHHERLHAEYSADASCKRGGKHSTWGRGKTCPDPRGAVQLKDEPKVKVPMGKGIDARQADPSLNNSSLLYNEFIVYDTKQIRQKYILQVKFKFRGGYY